MGLALVPSFLHGRLARRLLTVFVLVSVVPVSLASLIAYRQLVHGARTARLRELHQQVQTASLAFLSQMQEASAHLEIVRPGQASIESDEGEFEHVQFVPFGNPSERVRALSGLTRPVRAAIAVGHAAISWGRSGGRPALFIIRLQRNRHRLVRGQIDVQRMLSQVAGPDNQAGIALVDAADPTRVISSAYSHLPRAVLASLARAGVGRAPAREWHSADGRWLGATWELFLPAQLAGAPVRLVLGEPVGSIEGLAGLRWMIPLALFGAMAFAVLLAIRQLRSYLGPLETLTIATRRLAENNEHTLVHIDTDDELAMLGEDFNHMAEELLRRARFDGLTGLANRDFFRQSLGTRLAGATGAVTALLYIDLDAFKKINDSAGHEAGDEMLVAVAQRLRACVGDNAMLARLGGDEFAAILTSDVSGTKAEALATRILHALQTPFMICGCQRHISASIGVALAPEHGDSVELLLRNADIAMYEAKDSQGDRFARFTAEMHDRRRTEIMLEAELRGAIEREELELFYQPITDGKRLTGVEALLRWRRASGEQVSPAVFIPLAERSGLIIAIGSWVLQRACADFASWQAAAIAPEYVSVNVAPKQLLSSEFLATLNSALGSNGVPAARVHIEITESAVAEGREVEEKLRHMSALGVCLALDDFGTGYSSLSELHRLPFDVIKIDRSFVTDLPDSLVALQLVRAIVNMGHGLEKEVLAEGVETEAQRQLLRQLGCDSMQGYLLGRPVSEAALRSRLLAERKQADEAPIGVRWAAR